MDTDNNNDIIITITIIIIVIIVIIIIVIVIIVVVTFKVTRETDPGKPRTQWLHPGPGFRDQGQGFGVRGGGCTHLAACARP